VSPEQLEMHEPVGTLGHYAAPFDGLVLLGGGYLTDTFAWSTVQRAALIRTFEQQGKPVVLTGQQLGPFHSVTTARVMGEALRRADFVGVREPTDSLAFCREADVPRHALMGDDSFGLDSADDEARTLLERYGLEPGHFFAVNVRIGRYASEHEQHLDALAAQVRSLMDETGMPALVVPIALNETDSDVASGYRLKEAVGEDLLVLDESDPTPSLIKGTLGLAHGAVGVSYHFCTFALGEGVPAVCIYDGAYYGQKAAGLCAFWGDDRLALALPSTDLVPHVLSVWGDASLRDRLSVRAEEAKAEWHKVMEREIGNAFPRASGTRTPQSAVTA
jgi:polysaccharide pyruvyl transferase WcaK-like protein